MNKERVCEPCGSKKGSRKTKHIFTTSVGHCGICEKPTTLAHASEYGLSDEQVESLREGLKDE